MPNRNIPARRAVRRGLTLIDSLVCLAVIAALAGAAAPSFTTTSHKRVFVGTASEMHGDIQYSRSLAVARNQGVRLSFLSAANGASCVVIHSGAAADCTCSASAQAQCVAGTEVFRSHSFEAGSPVRVTANVGSMYIDPVRGTVTPTGTVRVVSGTQGEVHHVVNIMGRARTCSPNGTVSGYKAC